MCVGQMQSLAALFTEVTTLLLKFLKCWKWGQGVFGFQLFVLNWRQQPAYLWSWDLVSHCLVYLAGQDELWKKDSPPQKQWNFKTKMWGIKCSWKLKPWTLAPLTWPFGVSEPLTSLVHPRMRREHGTVAWGSPCTFRQLPCPALPRCWSHSPMPPVLSHRVGTGEVKLSYVLFTYTSA